MHGDSQASGQRGDTRSFREDGWAHFAAQNTMTNQSVVDSAIAGKLNLEFLEIVQTTGMDSEPEQVSVPEFSMGVTSGNTFGRMRVDGGEGVHNFHLAPYGGYLNHPETASQSVDIEGRAQFVLMALPIAEMSAFLGLDVSVLEDAIRPLHARLLTEDTVLRPLLLSMWHAALTKHHSSDLYVDQAFHTLALYTLALARGDTWGQQAFNDGDRATLGVRLYEDGAKLSPRHMGMVMEFINDHLGDPIRLADLAALVGMSNSTFSRAFKATTGEAAWAYVRRHRIEAAAELLQTTDISIAEVAFRTGFSSQQHLTKAFSDHIGVPPGKLRGSGSGRRTSNG